MLSLIVLVIIVALIFDFLNGFHDAANSIATVVSTRVLTPGQAVVWAAFFNFVAAFVFGTAVAKTVGTGLVDVKQIDVFVVLGGLTGAIVWNIITWLLGLPTSSSHALIGGIAGAAIAKAGFGVLIGWGWFLVLIGIVLSPSFGFFFGSTLMIAVSWIFRRATPHLVDTMFRRLQLVSAAIYSLGHGGNDAQKTMGIIVMVLTAAGREDWTTWGHLNLFGQTHNYGMPIILACHLAIALGTLAGGWRIVKTMGQSITRLQPVGGFCAETAAAVAIIGFTKMGGVPISTTHAITGAILGVGTTRGVRSVRWIWGQRIIIAWLLTLPCSALIAAMTYLIVHWTVEPLFG
ncbi:MAG: inorganic phosphate transporter [Phycisphaerales bacterium]|nr:inorganic phosphate transporter [Phycisphaerales bacterium]MCI0631536.1 inorganic phosphate transporter [Phycisphaerales bacterium]MCI0675583.1 inorganic phosphate transporter [Phycisphaerales bacterium]